MSHSVLLAWAKVKKGALLDDDELAFSDAELRQALPLRRFAILNHFMANPEATLERRAFDIGIPKSRLQELIRGLEKFGFLEQGLFGLMAAPGLRESK